MLLRRSMLLFAALSIGWAQSPATKKAPSRKKTSTAKAAPSTPDIDPVALKLLRAVAAKYRAAQSYSADMAIDAGRQVDENPRQPMAKAEVKLIAAPMGKYSLEVIEGDDTKPHYTVVSDGTRKWFNIAETKQYRELAASPNEPISGAESVAAGPLDGAETFTERLARQIVPLMANIDKTAARAYFRGAVMTIISKTDAQGHGFLLYLTLASEKGDVVKASWYQSNGRDNVRMLLRTDYVFTDFKALPSPAAAPAFTFTPPPGAVLVAETSPAAVPASSHH